MAAFMLFTSVGAFASTGTKKANGSDKLKKKVKFLKPANKYIFRYVSSCGAYSETVYWCLGCSSFELWQAEYNAVNNAELACLSSIEPV